MKRTAGIIGAGFGGLAASIVLASRGWEVDVFEKNEAPGGKAAEIRSNGFRFDTGPSLLTMPFVLDELFEIAGVKRPDYLTFRVLPVICSYFYPDGTNLKAYADKEQFAAEIDAKTTDSANAVKGYLDYCEEIYDHTAELFLFSRFREKQTFLNAKALKTLINLPKIDPFRTMHRANTSWFSDPKTVQLFDRYATYNGSSPFMAPATLNVIQHVEYNLGGFIPEGGIYKIVEALRELAEKLGVRFHFGKEVKSINIDKKRAKSVEIDAETLEFDVILSNADVLYSFTGLLSDRTSSESRRYQRIEQSSSAVVFYLGMQGSRENLNTHNIFFSENYKEEFRQLFEERQIPEDPTVYLYISSKEFPEDAPEGHENWFVMINAPWSAREIPEKELEWLKKKLLHKIAGILGEDLSEKVVYEASMTPKGIMDMTNSPGGSIYGISSNDRNAAFLRQKNRSDVYKNLYFCGGSAHPGGGIPLALLSGKLTAEAVMEDFG